MVLVIQQLKQKHLKLENISIQANLNGLRRKMLKEKKQMSMKLLLKM